VLSEFVMQDPQKQYDAPYRLQQGGFRATSGHSSRGPTIVVEHHEAELADVEAIVYAVDGAARRY
jgi:hypothetical protein